MNLKSRRITSALERFKADVKTTNPQDTTRIADLTCKFELNKLRAAMGDSLHLFCGRTAATVRLQPGTLDPAKPKIGLSLEADSLFARMMGNKMGMNKAGFAVTAEKLRDSVWAPKGIIGFNRLVVKTPSLALPIRMRKTSVTVGDRTITLNATMRIGRSDITASGAVYNLYEALRRNTLLRAHLTVSSRNLDCNQLINAMNLPPDTLQAETDTIAATDSLGTTGEADLSLFVIPKNWDFELQTHLGRVVYDKMEFEDVQGAVDVRNQAVHLKGLSMRSLGRKCTRHWSISSTERARLCGLRLPPARRRHLETGRFFAFARHHRADAPFVPRHGRL